LFFLSSLVGRLFGFDWALIKHEGRDYVPLDDVAKFYSFAQADFSQDRVGLSNETLRMQGAVNSRELYLNGLKFILSFPIAKVDERIVISRLDLSKLVEPVLRPARIQAGPARTVVLDAGHGGHDQGARSIVGNEKQFTFDVVMRARTLLTKAGYRVRLTRSSDMFIPLELRARFTNRQSSAIFVSIHFNSGFRADAAGIETYALAPRGVPSTNDPTLSLADFRPCIGNVRDPENIALASAMHSAMITTCNAFDRGIKRARFVVLRDVQIPGVLIEGGFLSNATERSRIANPAYRQLLAQAILQGVESYNRALRRAPGSKQMLVEQERRSTPPTSETAASVWDPLKSNVYELPGEVRQ
jgi:N-acetylmuramoyl-L-alanine amidase